MSQPSTRRELARAAARTELWRRGDLSWKLCPSSLEVYRAMDAAPRLSTYVQESSRKVGKSFLALVKSFEACLANPGQRVNYGTSTGKAAMEIVVPLVAQVAVDAPPELRPVYNGQTGHITFPKEGPAEGAYIVLFGCENQLTADRGRGPEAVFNVIDEAGFIPILRYVMTDVLKPQVIYTKGKTLVLSSPPLSQGHEFCAIADAARARGLYSHRNVYSPGGLFNSPEEIEEYIESFALDLGITVEAFRKTATFKREVLGQRCIDERLAVVPEFSDVEFDSTGKHPVTGEDVLLRGIVRPHPRPAGWDFVDTYTAIDPGMSDNTGGVFAFNDFLAGGLVVVEDELLLHQAATPAIAAGVRAKEAELWKQKKVRLRVMDDIGKRLRSDMQTEHGLAFAPLVNNDREVSINLLRVLVGGRRLVIHPRCVNLIRQLRHAVRVKPGGDIARSETEGHYDLVAAAYHLVRHVNRTRNPYPADFGEPVDLPGFHRVGGTPPRTTPMARALLGGTPLGRRLLKGGRGKR